MNELNRNAVEKMKRAYDLISLNISANLVVFFVQNYINTTFSGLPFLL